MLDIKFVSFVFALTTLTLFADPDCARLSHCSIVTESGAWAIKHHEDPSVACALARDLLTHAGGGEVRGQSFSPSNLKNANLICRQGTIPVPESASVQEAVDTAMRNRWGFCALSN